MLSGWFGLCIGLLPNGVPLEALDYARVPFKASGSPLISRLDWMTGPQAPAGVALTHGGLFDSAVGGRCLFVFGLLPQHTEIPHRVPPTEITIVLSNPVQLAVNASVDGAIDVVFERGTSMGTWNGMVMRATARLVTIDGALVSSAKRTVKVTEAASAT